MQLSLPVVRPLRDQDSFQSCARTRLLEYMKYDGNNAECYNAVTTVIKVQLGPRGHGL